MKPFVFKSLVVIISLGIFFFVWKIFFQKENTVIPVVQQTPGTQPLLGKPVEILDAQIIQENSFDDSNYTPSEHDFNESQKPSKKEITDEDLPLTTPEFN